jgi:hypothetical protein
MNQEWRKIGSEPSPSSRFNHGMVYIANDNIAVLYGGVNTTNHAGLSDTWIYHLSTNEWEKKNPEISPPRGSDSNLVYNSQKHKILLFGGFRSGILYDDLWEYDIDTNNWTKVNDINNPSARYGHSLISNSINNMTYLFGGSTSIYKNDFWEYNHTSLGWNLFSCITKPHTRYWHRMSYITFLNIGFLFGGSNINVPNGVLGDTWFFNFNNSEWIEQNPESSPSSRALYSMIFNSVNNKIYLYGGIGESYTKTWSDFWLYDFESNQWVQIHTLPPFLKFIRDYWWVLVTIAAGCIVSIIGITILKKKHRPKKVTTLNDRI